MKKILVSILLLLCGFAKAQKIDSIFVNLYTDSLKKGTYNYINIDGRLSNGSYMPLDSSHVSFWTSDGKFYGNTLLIDKDFGKEKVLIRVSLKSNPAISREFTMFVKKNPDNERLKTPEEIIRDVQDRSSDRKKKRG